LSRAALAAAQQGLAHLPGDAGVLYAAALSFEELGQADAALAHYDRALCVAPQHEDALHNRGLLLARQRLGDLMLDAVHHSAMTTACDALAAALPVLTLRGTAMASRAGESLLRAAGLPELVAADQDSYVAQALQLASDPPRLAAYRRRLAARAGPLFDTATRVRELETAFVQEWRQGARRA